MLQLGVAEITQATRGELGTQTSYETQGNMGEVEKKQF